MEPIVLIHLIYLNVISCWYVWIVPFYASCATFWAPCFVRTLPAALSSNDVPCGVIIRPLCCAFSSQAQVQWSWPEEPENIRVLPKESCLLNDVLERAHLSHRIRFYKDRGKKCKRIWHLNFLNFCSTIHDKKITHSTIIKFYMSAVLVKVANIIYQFSH